MTDLPKGSESGVISRELPRLASSKEVNDAWLAIRTRMGRCEKQLQRDTSFKPFPRRSVSQESLLWIRAGYKSLFQVVHKEQQLVLIGGQSVFDHSSDNHFDIRTIRKLVIFHAIQAVTLTALRFE